jgi:hypothetical protein
VKSETDEMKDQYRWWWQDCCRRGKFAKQYAEVLEEAGQLYMVWDSLNESQRQAAVFEMYRLWRKGAKK